ncbi:MAG: hypothetical protein RL417_1397 [Pseudomonadota bacterium]
MNPVNGRGGAGAPGLTVWSTTFADILTLVLSFFIATISVSPLNPASESALKRQIPSDPKLSGELADKTMVAIEGGTSLAVTPMKTASLPPVEVLEFTDSDFDGGRERLVPSADERLKNAVRAGGYHRLAVRIESCDRAGDELRGRERGLTLRRQIIDAGGGRATLRLAVLDGFCVSVPGLSADATARVTLHRTG